MELPSSVTAVLVPPCRADRITPCDIFDIVHDAVRDGIIDGISMAEFNEELARLTPAESEDYIQALWDRL